MSSEITPGQAAYEEWCSQVSPNAHLPKWVAVPTMHESWERIARAAIVASGDVQAAYERGLEDGGA